MKNDEFKKSNVPVGKGTIVGAVLLLFSIMTSLPSTSDDLDQVGKTIRNISFVAGLMLFGGGLYVFIAERRALTAGITTSVSPEKIGTQKWVYVFILLCGTLLFVGGIIGTFIGVGGAYRCFLLSRSQTVSIPRRVYGCIITVGVTWILYFIGVGMVAQLVSPFKH